MEAEIKRCILASQNNCKYILQPLTEEKDVITAAPTCSPWCPESYFVVIMTVYKGFWSHVRLQLTIPPGVLQHTQLPLQHSLHSVKYFCISQCIQFYPRYLPMSLGIRDLTRSLHEVYKCFSQFLDQRAMSGLMMKQLRCSDQCSQRLQNGFQ